MRSGVRHTFGDALFAGGPGGLPPPARAVPLPPRIPDILVTIGDAFATPIVDPETPGAAAAPSRHGTEGSDAGDIARPHETATRSVENAIVLGSVLFIANSSSVAG